jgi:hypothetical protein
MQELRYVDTAAEKLIKTVSSQKFTVSETTQNNEYRKHAITAENVKNVHRSRKLGEAEERLVSFF